jgi:hypothetical protein
MVLCFLRHLFVSPFFLHFEKLNQHELKYVLNSVVSGCGALDVGSLETLSSSLTIEVIDLPLV